MSSRTIRCSSTTIYHSLFSITLVLVPHILREDGLATYPQGGWAPEQLVVLLLLGTCHHVSSGRMSSLHILREDELEDHWVFSSSSWVSATLTLQHISSGRISSLHILRENELADYLWSSPLPWCLPPHVLREDELATNPQVRMSSGTICCSFTTMMLSGKVFGLFLNSSFYYRLRFCMPSSWRTFSQYPQGGWAQHISSVRMSSGTFCCSFTTIICMPSFWRTCSQHPQGGWAQHISSVRMSVRTKLCFSL